MTAVVLCFGVHRPYRLRRFRFFDVGTGAPAFDEGATRAALRRAAERCYLPMNQVIAEAIERTGGAFRCAFSLSGTALSQLEAWAPEALGSFVALARTGAVEVLGETSHHSLAAVEDLGELDAQVTAHRDRIERVFGRRPTTFRNTGLVVSDAIAERVERLGFETILCEGAPRMLGWRSPREVYRLGACRRLRALPRSWELSDDVAFRFGDRSWPEHPLLADRFAARMRERVPDEDPFVGLFLDYETFGEHQPAESGILEFARHLPDRVLAGGRFRFATPAEAAGAREPAGSLSVPDPVSWAGPERDLSAWLGNHMQREAHGELYRLRPEVGRAAERAGPSLLEEWRRLSTADHFRFMGTAPRSEEDGRDASGPYDTPHDAFINYMNVLDDLAGRARSVLEAPPLDGPITEAAGGPGTEREVVPRSSRKDAR